MADLADSSDERIQLTIDAGIAKSREALTQRMLVNINMCHYCQSDLNNGRLFCDAECSKDWQFEQDRLRSIGR